MQATDVTTTVSFAFRQDPSWFNFDDASVVDVSQLDVPFTNTTITIAPSVPDQGVGIWTTAATLLGMCALAGYRRRQVAA